MKKWLIALIIFLVVAAAAILLIVNYFTISKTESESYSKEDLLKPVTFNEVTLDDTFWKNRMEIQKRVLVPVAFERTQSAVDDLKKTAAFLKGDTSSHASPSRFVTSDLYKVIEGAAYLLTLERDAALEKQIDDIAEIISQAQEEDGYLYPAHTTGSFRSAQLWGGAGMGDKPYSWVIHSHELYNVGHLYEAAVAYYYATGKKNLLDIAEKSAKHINKVFFEGGDTKYNDGKPVNQAPGHQEMELALVKLYRATGNDLYLQMAKKFIDIRGVTYKPEGDGVMTPEYSQQHRPVREQDKAVGHAVRAAYLYSAMADVGSLTGDNTLQPALHKIWDNIMDTKFHITGGLGAVHGIEGFGDEYDLPNKEAYDETCAAVGNVFFNHRMFLLEKDGKYMDVAEVSLLNNVLAGVNLEGNKFFYVNPLESEGMVDRSFWFGTACCPTNLARLIPQVSGLMYAHNDHEIYCALYTSNHTDIKLKNGNINLKQISNYPFDETIKVEVNPENKDQQFNLKMRIPTWFGTQFVPGKLYTYIDKESHDFSLYINGKEVKNAKVSKGFVTIDREWNKGDQVELRLPMTLRYTKADSRVKADAGKLALTRGPLVYCAEGVDNEQYVNRYIVAPNADYKIEKVKEGSLKDIEIVENVPAKYIALNGKAEDRKMTLIPYYAWNNRGVSTMNVWFADNENVIKENGYMIPVGFSSISASHTYKDDNVLAIVSGKFPESSKDTGIKRWTSHPEKGKRQTIEFEFEQVSNVKSFSVYWYEDTDGVKLPKSWSLEYSADGQKWQSFPLYTTDTYSLIKDQFNLVHSAGDKLMSKKFRLNMTPQPDKSVGILQIKFDLK
ncbi:glycoside hydrolase family 127 protein [Prevotella sp. 10(H)]|uniref:glycoside hydrolase family 127 protein n=1 Tax=Prevotella sp. 10(H) TaxID=1158294 RepID=UPI0004A784FA|nr:beta-L-arabinofuranosidase domain-containing protein [Prevotella sp. 10(H)]